MARKPKDTQAVAPADVAEIMAAAEAPAPAGRGRKLKEPGGTPLRATAGMARSQRGRKSDPAQKTEPNGAAGPVDEPDHPVSVTVDAGTNGGKAADTGMSAGDIKASGPTEPLMPAASSAEGPGVAKPAAQWDQATDAVRFDWPEIERTALQQGTNQVMAKLLLAARAEGANSRWPLMT